MVQMRPLDSRWSLLLAGAGILSLTTLACPPSTTTTTRGATGPATGGRPECPHTPQIIIQVPDTVDDDKDRDGDERVVTRDSIVSQIPLSGPISDVPEYHDCQRFIVDSADTVVYGSLYAIFARNRLHELETRIETFQDDSVYPLYDDSVVAVPGASIYAYGEKYDPGRYDKGFYGQLKIEPGFNCLYFSKDGDEWQAWMIKKGLNDPHCPEPLVNPPEAMELEVTRSLPGGTLSGEDIPAAARWDWDAGGGEQYIGIRCGEAWCEVSDDGTASAQPPITGLAFASDVLGSPTAQMLQRVMTIKGWYDAQRLALRGSAGNSAPSNVLGYVIPHPTLFRQTLAMYGGRWIQVATVLVTADYRGATVAFKSGQQNDIYLCEGETCVPDGKRPDCVVPLDNERMMWMMVVTGPDSSYHCGVRRTPSSEDAPPRVPGTARWRWLAKDETTWKRCDEGCCELT
jgi:hypothetical protein